MTRDLFDTMNDGDEQVERVKSFDLDMVLHYDTGRAVLVSDTGEEARAVWLPKSHIEIDRADGKTSGAVRKDGQRVVLPVVSITLPEWLAKDKGLI